MNVTVLASYPSGVCLMHEVKAGNQTVYVFTDSTGHPVRVEPAHDQEREILAAIPDYQII